MYSIFLQILYSILVTFVVVMDLAVFLMTVGLRVLIWSWPLNYLFHPNVEYDCQSQRMCD